MTLLPEDFDAVARKAPLFWDVVRLFDPEVPPWDALDPTFQNALDHAVGEIVPAGDELREAQAEAQAEAKRWEEAEGEAQDELEAMEEERDDALRLVAVLEREVTALEDEVARLRGAS